MSQFLLQPARNDASDPAWALSWHMGPCKVTAETAEHARRIAAGWFTVALHPGEHLSCRRSPWLDEHLVLTERLDADRGPAARQPVEPIQDSPPDRR